MPTIEDVILQHDSKGIGAVRKHLPPDYCDIAARLMTGEPGTAFLVTGFYILSAGLPETDGPPGVVAVAHAAKLLAEHRPVLLLATERCGLTQDGVYLNMRGRDISAHTARVDHLFDGHPRSIGVGDGGNEIGMGNLAEFIPRYEPLPKRPCVTTVTAPVIASVANWGCYGVVAALSRLLGRNLLIGVDEERRLVERYVEIGAVDGATGDRTATVDGHTLDVNEAVLTELHRLIGADP